MAESQPNTPHFTECDIDLATRAFIKRRFCRKIDPWQGDVWAPYGLELEKQKPQLPTCK